MIGLDERLENLKKFGTIYIDDLNFQDKDFRVGFNPTLGLFKLIPKDKESDKSIATFAITVTELNKPEHKTLSKYDRAESLLQKARVAWKKIPKKKRNEFIDKIPLNSFFLGGDTLTY